VVFRFRFATKAYHFGWSAHHIAGRYGVIKGLNLWHESLTLRFPDLLGTPQYTAPEYFLGEGGTPRSDMFSLGVITYQMLTGKLPYGTQVAKTRTKSAQNKLKYDSVLDEDREIPAWIDDVLRKAVHPNQAFLNKKRPPLLERNPAAFWSTISFILAIIIAILLTK
jgi:serine/threonine protein kinase